jgi:hypothetical protein
MKQTIQKQISDRIERRCKKDLETHERAGIDREPLLLLLANFAETRGRRIPTNVKKMVDYHHSVAKKSATELGKLALEQRASMEKPPYMKPSPDSPFAKAILAVEFLAASRKKDSLAMGEYLERRGRDHPDAGCVLDWILSRNPKFDKHESLSRLLNAAFDSAGIGEDKKERKHLSAEACRSARDRWLQRKPRWTAKETDVWPQF